MGWSDSWCRVVKDESESKVAMTTGDPTSIDQEDEVGGEGAFGLGE